MKKIDPREEAFAGIGLGHSVATAEPQLGHSVAIEEPQVATLRPVHIRLPVADLAALEAIASQEGTTTAALVRRAIKALIRKERGTE